MLLRDDTYLRLAAGSSASYIDNISTAEIGGLQLVPQPDSGLGEYAGSTSTDSCYVFARQAFESDQPHADESHCCLTPILTATPADIQVLEEPRDHPPPV